VVRIELANVQAAYRRRIWTLTAKEIPGTPGILGDMAQGVGKVNV